MAQKVAVLGENRHVKRTVAFSLVRRQTHDWVIVKVSIKARPISEFRTTTLPLEYRPSLRYVPEKLPPAEVGGCHFVGPIPDLLSRVNRLCRVSGSDKLLREMAWLRQ